MADVWFHMMLLEKTFHYKVPQPWFPSSQETKYKWKGIQLKSLLLLSAIGPQNQTFLIINNTLCLLLLHLCHLSYNTCFVFNNCSYLWGSSIPLAYPAVCTSVLLVCFAVWTAALVHLCMCGKQISKRKPHQTKWSHLKRLSVSWDNRMTHKLIWHAGLGSEHFPLGAAFEGQEF